MPRRRETPAQWAPALGRGVTDRSLASLPLLKMMLEVDLMFMAMADIILSNRVVFYLRSLLH